MNILICKLEIDLTFLDLRNSLLINYNDIEMANIKVPWNLQCSIYILLYFVDLDFSNIKSGIGVIESLHSTYS